MTIQNQWGRNPIKWHKTGVVVEIRPHEQVVVKVDASRRLTLRNRRFIRELYPGKTCLEDQLAVPERLGAPDNNRYVSGFMEEIDATSACTVRGNREPTAG